MTRVLHLDFVCTLILVSRTGMANNVSGSSKEQYITRYPFLGNPVGGLGAKRPRMY